MFHSGPLKALLATTRKLTNVPSKTAQKVPEHDLPLRHCLMTDNVQRWQPKSGDTLNASEVACKILTLYLREVEILHRCMRDFGCALCKILSLPRSPCKICPGQKTSETAGRNAFARFCPPPGSFIAQLLSNFCRTFEQQGLLRRN